MTVTNPINELIPHIQTAMEEWYAQQTPQHIKGSVRAQLDRQSKEVLMKLLGFDVSYGNSWKIDHCNGRMDNSLAGTTLREIYKESVKEWLSEVGLPKLTKKEVEDLQETLHTEYVASMRRELRAMVRTRAQEDLEQLLKEALPKPAIDEYLAAYSLITDH